MYIWFQISKWHVANNPSFNIEKIQVFLNKINKNRRTMVIDAENGEKTVQISSGHNRNLLNSC